MNDFVNAAEAPDFDTAGIVRRARRKRATAIAGIATALIVAGGGTALASINSGSDTSKPAADSTGRDTTLLYTFDDGATLPIDMGGWDQESVRVQFLKMRVKGEYAKAATGTCKPGSVIGVSPHSPQTVDTGDTVKVTLCAG
ncbi:hypothetical protein [Streptomyces violaceusniger]